MLNSTEYEIDLLITVKMLTIVGILTFISRINTSGSSKARTVFIFQHFSIYDQLAISCSLEMSMNIFYILGVRVFTLLFILFQTMSER